MPMCIAAAVLFFGCNKENATPGGQTPTPPQTKFNIEQTALTQGSFSARITPADNEAPYYFGVVTKKEFNEKYGDDTEVLQEAYIGWFNEMATANGLSLNEFLSNALLSGMQDYQFRALDPETEYLFFVFGVSYEGKVTTETETLEFKTPKAVLKENAKIDISLVEAGSTWFKVKFDCSDPDIFYYYDVMTPDVYEQYCGSNPENIKSYMESYLSAMKSENDTFKAMTMAQFITSLTVSGEKEYDTALSEAANSLLPEMSYPVFAIGLGNDGSFTTEPFVQMISTTESPKNDWVTMEETVSDTDYKVTIVPAWDEVYAAILERTTYFQGLTDQESVEALLAARKGSLMNDLYTGKINFTASSLIPSEDYTLFLIACTPDGLPKTGDKLNVKKIAVTTAVATMTGAVYSVKVYDITKTDAKVSVSGNTAAEGQTYMLNYITKERLAALAATEGSESAAYKKACDELIDSRLESWNSGHADAAMDRKEFLSRSLLTDIASGTYYDIPDLTAGTTYEMYVIGLKADGTYTTEPFVSEFTTVADKKSQISLSVGMTAWMWDDIFPNQTNYTVSATAKPYNLAGGAYCKYFLGADEWSGKSGAEMEELLKKEQAGLYGSASANFRIDRGTKFFVYFIGVDTDGVATDIIKVTHTAREEGSSGTGMGMNVSIDKTETIPVR